MEILIKEMTNEELEAIPYGRVLCRWTTKYYQKEVVTRMKIVKDPHTFCVCGNCGIGLTHKSVKTIKNETTLFVQCLECAYKWIMGKIV